MRSNPDSGIYSRIFRLVGIAVAVVFLLPTCHPVSEGSPDYLPPQMELEGLVSYYPLEAYLKGLEGRVVMLVRIEETGDVSDVRVAVSSGAGILDSAAQVIARVIRFSPAQVHGQPQALWLRVPIVFTLDQTDRASINLRGWRRTARDLQSAASAGEPEERRVAERELLDHYVQLAYKMVDSRAVSANRIILEVAMIPVQDNWRDYQRVWPLPFVLFRDFLARYPQSEYAGLAGNYFRDYLQHEAALLGKTPSIGSATGKERQKLLQVLLKHLEEGF
ncbi:energy transducer TonB [Candidatus Neomarinimicrobiota bacterium]